jgi:hypothetical protein
MASRANHDGKGTSSNESGIELKRDGGHQQQLTTATRRITNINQLLPVLIDVIFAYIPSYERLMIVERVCHQWARSSQSGNGWPSMRVPPSAALSIQSSSSSLLQQQPSTTTIQPLTLVALVLSTIPHHEQNTNASLSSHSDKDIDDSYEIPSSVTLPTISAVPITATFGVVDDDDDDNWAVWS